MRNLILSVVVPIVVSVCVCVLVFAMPDRWLGVALRALPFLLCVAQLPIGVWIRRTAKSKGHSLAALIGPIAYLLLWAYMLQDAQGKLGVRLFGPGDYAMGLAPMVGLLLGYVGSTLARRVRASV